MRAKPRCGNIPHVVRILSFLTIILLFSSCATPRKIIVSDFLDSTPVVSGAVINDFAFARGGTLVLGPFKPGTGAAANDETDQLSLMITKGIYDTLSGEHTHFIIQTGDLAQPDCFLEGYIEDYGRQGNILHQKLRQNQAFLSVNGEIWLRETGEKILSFETSVVIDLKTQSPKTAAYQMGAAIARFIGSFDTGPRRT